MPKAGSSRGAVFLDRDGVLAEEVGYLNHISRFKLFSFAAAQVRRLNEARLPVFVVTNQSGVGRGYFPEKLVEEVHAQMAQEIAREGARLDGVYYCPHVSAEECDCRKPKTGMLLRASREHQIDLAKSYVVGDRYGDVLLAKNAGARSILVKSGYGAGELLWHSEKWDLQPDLVAENLVDATDWILRCVQ